MQLRYTAKLDQIALCQNILKEKHFYVKNTITHRHLLQSDL